MSREKKIVLASKSPRRKQLLKQIKLPFDTRTENVDESTVLTKDPKKRVKQLAMLKNEAVSFQADNEIIISADTVVSFQNKIFGKPHNEAQAYQMIKTFSGNIHDVYTGVMIRSKDNHMTFVEHTEVEFWPLDEKEIRKYIKTSEPYDKAGAYGIQSLGALFVKRIIGDYYNVVGLPIAKMMQQLKKFNI